MNYPSIYRWLVEHTSLEPALLQGAGFETVVAERLAESATDESAYVATLERSADEVDRLTANIAVPETWLFRYPRSFDLLVEFLQRRRSEHGSPSLRMCSIGCATGQEPYCMAIAALHAGWTASQVSIIGLDRNRDFLRAAAAAEYGSASIRGEIPSWTAPYLTRRSDHVGIDQAAQAMVQFVQADVTNPAVLSSIGTCEAIFCRNLMIYLNSEARARLLNSICSVLAIDGVLFVGHAEQVIRAATPLRAMLAPQTFALERITATAIAEQRLPPRIALERPLKHTQQPAVTANLTATMASRLVASVPDLTLDRAKDLADAGRMHEAETMVRSIISRHGPSAPVLELLGTIRMAANDLSEAKRSFEQSVYLEPTRTTSLLQLALISERSGDPSRAALLWDRARRASTAGEKERLT